MSDLWSGLWMKGIEDSLHTELSDMPDSSGVNTDHDSRYFFSEQNTCYVSPSYTDNNNSRKFSSIQAAINYANSQTPTVNSKWLVKISSGTYVETLTLYEYIYFIGEIGPTTFIAHPLTILNLNVQNTSFTNVDFVSLGAAPIITTTGAGVAGNGGEILFERCSFIQNSSLNNIDVGANSYLFFYGCFFFQQTSTDDVSFSTQNVSTVRVQFYVCFTFGQMLYQGGDIVVGVMKQIGNTTVSNSASLEMFSSDIRNPNGNSVDLDTNGSVSISASIIRGSGTGNTRAVDISVNPASCSINNCVFEYINTQPNFLIYSSVSFSYSGVGNSFQRGCNSNIRNASSLTKHVGLFQEYNAIQTAITAAQSNDVVAIEAGTYNEQITLKSNVTITSSNKDLTIVEFTSGVVSYDVGYTGSTISNLTFNVTTAENNITDITEGSPVFDNCVFTNGYISHDSQVATLNAIFRECNIYKITIANTVPIVSTITVRRCTISNAVNINIRSGNIYFYDSTMFFVLMNVNAAGNIFSIIRCSMNAISGPLIDLQTTGGTYTLLRIINNELGILAGTILSISCNTSALTPEIVNNSFLAILSGTDILVNAGFAQNNVSFSGNSMTKGVGGPGTFTFSNPVKQVGGTHDFYSDIVTALANVNANNSVILLNKDQVVTSALTPPSFQIKIDGNHEFSLTRSAGNPIMVLGANDKVSFVNIDLIGSIDVAGDNVSLELADNTYLNGMVDIQSGNANTIIKMQQCEIIGDAVDNYVLRIADVDPSIIVKNSYLKSNGNNPAVYWDLGVNNNNLDIAFSSIMHGNLGANNPFGRNSTQTPIVSSHHNVYNATPFGAVWTNDIAGSNDTFDPEGDF